MKQLNQMCLPFILLLIIIIVFIVLLINHSELLDNDRNYSFQAIQKQTDSSVLNTVDRDGEFVNANSREIERAMRITRDDNKFKYMDISQQVLCQNKKLKRCYEEWY